MSATEPTAPEAPPADWASARGAALSELRSLALAHARDLGSPAADLQAFASRWWTALTGDRPGLGRTPRFPVPDDLSVVTDALLHPEPLGRAASAADVATALAALGDPASTDALLLPDASDPRPPRPVAPWPEVAPDGVDAALWAALGEVRASGRSRRVSVAGDDVVGAMLALALAVDTTGVGAAWWRGVGPHAVSEGSVAPGDAALRRARATGVDPGAARAELDDERAWAAGERVGDDPRARGFARELRGECWRGAAVLLLTGVAAAPGDARRWAAPWEDQDLPLLVVTDAPLDESPPLELSAAPPPAASTGDRRLTDARHLVALAGGVVPRAVAARWAGTTLPALTAAPGVWTWGGHVWLGGPTLAAWSAEALARPDARYLERRVARALATTCPARAALAALAAGDDDLAEALALGAPGPRPFPAGLASEPAHPGAGAAAAAALLARAPTRTLALARRAQRAEHLAFERAWAGDPARGAQWLAESRATEGSGAVGLRRALGLATLRQLAGDDAGADAAWDVAADLADDPEQPAVALRRAAACVWTRRWELARASLDRARAGRRLEGEVGWLTARLERGTGALGAAVAAAEAAAPRFVEARSTRGELRAHLERATAAAWAGTPPAPGDLAEWRARAAAAHALDVVAEVDTFRSALARRAGDADAARAAASAAARIGAEQGHLSGIADSGLALARALHASGRPDEAAEAARVAVAGLGSWPRHPAWAPYRAFVAGVLAERGDHTQTWQWLWSAQEAGLASLVDPDVADDLERLVTASVARGWGNVLRLAGKLAQDHAARLGDAAGAEAVAARVADALKR